MRKIALLAAVVTAAPAHAQENATVTGRVTNASGQPEAAVLVRLLPGGDTARTDASGAYRLVIPGARIRAGQHLALAANRPGLAVRTGVARSASCDGLVFDIQVQARNRIGMASGPGTSLMLATDVPRLCARIRDEGAVLRRADLQGTGNQDVLTTLGTIAGLRYSIGTAGGRPSLRIGGRSAEVDPVVYVDGRPADLSALARMRSAEAEAVWIRPGHLPGRPGEPAAPGGAIRVMRSSHGVSADSLLQKMDGFWWPPLPPRPAVREGMLRRVDLPGAGDRDLSTGLSDAAAFRPAKVGGRPLILIGADTTVTAEPLVYLNGARQDLGVLTRLRVSEVDSVEIRPARLPARGNQAPGPGGAILIWRAAPPASR